MQESSDDSKCVSYFIALLNSLCDPLQEPELKAIVGRFYHEIMNILEQRDLDCIEFVDPLVKLLKCDDYNVQVSVLPYLGRILNILNTCFKNKVLLDLWDLEKFSLKEA